MSKYNAIKNVSVYADLTNTPTVWDFRTGVSFSPDEIIVRQISYHGPPAGDGLFMIWCNLTNNYIGTFSVAEATGFLSVAVNVNPNTVIQCLPNTVVPSIQFQIHSVNNVGAPAASNNLTGQIAINLDFCKYVR